MHPDSAESSVVRTYLDWMVELPWKKETKDNIRIGKAKEILDEDHHDLEKVKERILEYLSVRKLKNKRRGRSSASSVPRAWGKRPSGSRSPRDGPEVHPHVPGRYPGRGGESAATAGRTWGRFPDASSRG